MVFENLKKTFKTIYNKDDFDYSTGIVHPFEFHTIFYFMVKSFRIVDEPPQPRMLYFMILLAVGNGTGLCLASVATFHYVMVKDVINFVQAFTYGIILMYKLVILFCCKYNLPNYHFFFKMLKEDFHYICTEGVKYRKAFFDTQLRTWKICICTIILLNSLAWSMTCLSFVLFGYYIISLGSPYSIEKPQLIPYWLFDVDFKKSPVYEISFIYGNYIIFVYGYSYTAHIIIMIHWVRHITLKADLINYGLEDLMDGIKIARNTKEKAMFNKILMQRMRDLIKQHIALYSLLENFAVVYRKLFTFEQKITCIIVCLTAYASAEKLSQGELHVILTLLCVAVITVAFIPAYLVDFLNMKVKSICDTCSNVPFWKASGSVLRPYLVIMMQRSLRRLPLQQAGFPETSLKTFSNSMTSAYSMFNMLRQADLDF